MNRREFVERAAVVTGAVSLGAPAPAAEQQKTRKITDRVKLGKTGLVSSLMGIGTGSVGWNKASNQTRLGQKKFTELMHAAYENGIRFFDVADQYGSHPYLKEAIKGLPRESFLIQTKSTNRTPEGIRADVERFLKELGVDYVDTLLMHCVTEPDWNTQFRAAKDVLSELKQKGLIRAHGCSCHSLAALEAAAADPWVEVDLARFNPWGRHMDFKPGTPITDAPKHVQPVLQRMKQAGKGVIGMKILAQGDMMQGETRLANARESIRFALKSQVIDVMVVGFESPRQIAEILGETRVALSELNLHHA
jgi:aryl-alcohol dehydrogenase-like predicted oxidoreductase